MLTPLIIATWDAASRLAGTEPQTPRPAGPGTPIPQPRRVHTGHLGQGLGLPTCMTPKPRHARHSRAGWFGRYRPGKPADADE